MYDNRYEASFELPTADGKVRLTATTRITTVSLVELLRRLGACISTAISNRKRWDNAVMSGVKFCYEWDGDVSDLPTLFHNQASSMRQTSMEMLHPDQIVGKPREPRLLEVCKVGGVWTIKKHETELLTWAEACNELAKRI